MDYERLSGDRLGESSASIRARVQAARKIQLARFSKIESSNIVENADMRVGEIRQFCNLQDEGQSLMRATMSQINLSSLTSWSRLPEKVVPMTPIIITVIALALVFDFLDGIHDSSNVVATMISSRAICSRSLIVSSCPQAMAVFTSKAAVI